MSGIVLLVVAQLRLVQPQRRKMRRSSIGRRSIRWRATSSISSRSLRRLAGSLIAGLFDLDRVAGGAGIALLMSGLAVIVATGDLVHLRRQRLLRSVWAVAVVAPALAVIATTLFLPWTGSAEVATSLPATRRSRVFSATALSGAPTSALRAVAGDPQTREPDRAGPARPHLLLDADAGADAMADAGEIQ